MSNRRKNGEQVDEKSEEGLLPNQDNSSSNKIVNNAGRSISNGDGGTVAAYESDDDRYCFFCGTFPEGSQLIDGVHGPICSSCVFSLSARLAEADRELGKKAPKPRTIEQLYEEEGDLPAHEYQNRVDLAGAYLELGKKNLALKEYFAALESSLICRDWAFALSIISKIRNMADGPTIRDRIHEALSLHGPKEL